jgi:hypothetical protein
MEFGQQSDFRRDCERISRTWVVAGGPLDTEGSPADLTVASTAYGLAQFKFDRAGSSGGWPTTTLARGRTVKHPKASPAL